MRPSEKKREALVKELGLTDVTYRQKRSKSAFLWLITEVYLNGNLDKIAKKEVRDLIDRLINDSAGKIFKGVDYLFFYLIQNDLLTIDTIMMLTKEYKKMKGIVRHKFVTADFRIDWKKSKPSHIKTN